MHVSHAFRSTGNKLPRQLLLNYYEGKRQNFGDIIINNNNYTINLLFVRQDPQNFNINFVKDL